jgi:N-methylhydantoinase A
LLGYGGGFATTIPQQTRNRSGEFEDRTPLKLPPYDTQRSLALTTILGIDIGGTFTDFVLFRDGKLSISKLPTTPDDPSRAVLDGVVAHGIPDTLIHGTTIATNALLERRGAVTALLTTAGFADVLVIGRGTRSSLYDLDIQRAPPVVPDALRLEICERSAFDGTILTPLDESSVQQAIEQLVAAGVESVAVCFLHSYRNPTHEERTVEMLRTVQRNDGSPTFFVCHSADVMPEYREYERTSTTVVNAYVAPVLDRYLNKIETTLEHETGAQGQRPRLHVMASDGGSMTAAAARRLAARTTLSGPAGGVVGALAVAQQAGFERVITFDMGGTSTDVALCEGHIPQTTESAVGGLPVRFPGIDIHTVGAGGGSLARLDAGGALRVGPQSAGAAPGPACYGKGTQPTVTDANLVLGRLRPDRFLGGHMSLDIARAQAALAPLAQHPGMDIPAVAMGIVRVANAAMERAIRTISVERGIDPRTFTLVSFGGAGGMHAAYLAHALGIPRVLIPRYPGVLSALGMITADMSRDYVHFLATPLAHLTASTLAQYMATLAEQGKVDFAHDLDKPPATDATAVLPLQAIFTLDMRYVGQSHEINTPLAVWEGMHPHLPDLAATAQQFHQLHQQYSGHAMPERDIEVVALRLKCVAATGQQLPRESPSGATHGTQPDQHHAPPAPAGMVPAALDAESTVLCQTAIYEREELAPGMLIPAPAIIVQYDTTCVIPPGWQASVDRHGNLVLYVT